MKDGKNVDPLSAKIPIKIIVIERFSTTESVDAKNKKINELFCHLMRLRIVHSQREHLSISSDQFSMTYSYFLF